MIRLIYLMLVFLICCNWLQAEKPVIAIEHGNLYQWHENKLLVLVADSVCKDVVIKVSEGKIWRDKDCQFRYTCSNTVKNVRIIVGIGSGDVTTWIDTRLFPVLPLPDPEPIFSIFHDTLTIWNLRWLFRDPMDSVVTCPDLWFRCTIPYHSWELHEHEEISATAYTVKVTREGNVIFNKWIKGDILDKESCEFLYSSVRSGDTILFEDIECLMYGRERRTLKESLIYIIK